MATPSAVPVGDERIERLEKRVTRTRLWVIASMLLNLLLVGIGLYHFGFHFASRTIEVRKVVLKDPSNHVLAVFGVDNNWDEIPSETYYPGIEFRDEKGNKKMGLFGTGVHFGEGDEWANLGFKGLDIGEKTKARILLYKELFSFGNDTGGLWVLPHPEGMNVSLRTGENEFAIRTNDKEATMYVASPRGELAVTANETGTGIQRHSKDQQ